MVTTQDFLKAVNAAAKQFEKSGPTKMVNLQNADFQRLVRLVNKVPQELLDAEQAADAPKKAKAPTTNISDLMRQELARPSGDADEVVVEE